MGTIPCGGHHTAPLGIAFSWKRGYTKGDLCGWGKPLNDHLELLRGWLWPKTRFSMNTNRDTGSSSPKPAGGATRLLSTYLLSCKHKSESPLHIRAISSSLLAEKNRSVLCTWSCYIADRKSNRQYRPVLKPILFCKIPVIKIPATWVHSH